MHDVFAVIMAGGSGTRFWPQSRKAWPKQFLALAGSEQSLLQQTVQRLSGTIPADRILVVTSERHAEATRQQLPDLPPANVLAEPIGRNTAPCVAWAAAHVSARSPHAVMAVLPSDPHIQDEAGYREVLSRALAAASDGGLVTIGVSPTRPETGYGYIEVGSPLSEGVHRVSRFVEKPDLERAQGFLLAGNFLWNSGMFFFRADVVLAEFERQLPDLFQFARGCRELLARGSSDREYVAERYAQLTSISIDHGIMERARDIRVVPGSFGWFDIGSWTTAYELAAKDKSGNAVVADGVLVDCERCYVRAKNGKVIALVGVKDLIVVDTEDALLILPRERAQDVRRVVEQLASGDGTRFL
ncbi:MAG TPA: mannose-1-phosphate guanylyltransferase [Polyangiales bacterium]|nr:mannose-1-phosphate guanylyltransferase [Polyangiales bacterium]